MFARFDTYLKRKKHDIIATVAGAAGLGWWGRGREGCGGGGVGGGWGGGENEGGFIEYVTALRHSLLAESTENAQKPPLRSA